MNPFRSTLSGTTLGGALGAVLLVAAFTAHAQSESASKGPVTAAQRQDEAAMMKECLAREQKKSGVDRSAAQVTCRAEQEAHRQQSAAPNADQRPASGRDGKSASGHSSHSGVEGKEQPSSEAK